MQNQKKINESEIQTIIWNSPGSKAKELLQAISGGHLERVKHLLHPDSLPVNLNCSDTFPKIPLMLAAEKEENSEQIIQLLIDNGANTDVALLHAIKQKNHRAFEILLQYRSKTKDKPKRETLNSQKFNFLSPILLASKLGEFEMVVQLMLHGDEVLEHHIKCACNFCSPAASSLIAQRLIRIESYKALANPVYICAQYIVNSNNTNHKDPIQLAFTIGTKLKQQAEVDYEYKEDYNKLCRALNDFCVNILDKCQQIDEIQAVMDTCVDSDDTKQNDIPEEARHLGLLDIAIAHQNEQFIAHPFSQLMLNYEVYRQYPTGKDKHIFLKFLTSIALAALFPIWAFCYFFLPNSRVTSLLRTPLIKYAVFIGFYLLFLLMVSFTVFQSETAFLRFSMYDGLVLLFVIGYCLDIGKEVYGIGRRRYFSSWYHCTMAVMTTSFILFYVIWVAAYYGLLGSCPGTSCKNPSKAEPYMQAIQVSYCFYSLGVLLSFLYLLSIFHFSSTLGPLLMALLKMLKNVSHFFSFFVLLYLAFVFCLSKLYWQYFQAVNNGKFASVYTASNSSHRYESPMESSFIRTLQIVFWSLFGRVQLTDFETVHGFSIIASSSLVFFGLFNVLAVLVAVNMLIAMLNESFSHYASSADTTWKYSRTKMLFSLIYKTNVLPPPLNLIPTPQAILLLFKAIGKFFCRHKECCLSNLNTNGTNTRTRQSARKKVLKKLIWRYLSSRENARNTSKFSLEELIREMPNEPLEKGASFASSEKLWKDNNSGFVAEC